MFLLVSHSAVLFFSSETLTVIHEALFQKTKQITFLTLLYTKFTIQQHHSRRSTLYMVIANTWITLRELQDHIAAGNTMFQNITRVSLSTLGTLLQTAMPSHRKRKSKSVILFLLVVTALCPFGCTVLLQKYKFEELEEFCKNCCLCIICIMFYFSLFRQSIADKQYIQKKDNYSANGYSRSVSLFTAAVSSSHGTVTTFVGATFTLTMNKEQCTLSSLTTNMYEH